MSDASSGGKRGFDSGPTTATTGVSGIVTKLKALIQRLLKR